jgi:GrpB-like predicted nucleotidyltransferase (UPF0157 family)
MDYDAEWQGRFELECNKVQSVLGSRALRIEHVESTAVPKLPAKPIIGVVLAVTDSSKETEYAAFSEGAGADAKTAVVEEIMSRASKSQ